MQQPKPETPDHLMARHTRRKVEHIASDTIAAFRLAIREYGTLSADELMAIGTEVIMQITILPLERLSDRPLQMRNAMSKVFAKLIKMGSEADG